MKFDNLFYCSLKFKMNKKRNKIKEIYFTYLIYSQLKNIFFVILLYFTIFII